MEKKYDDELMANGVVLEFDTTDLTDIANENHYEHGQVIDDAITDFVNAMSKTHWDT